MITIYVPFVMSDGKVGTFTVARACSMQNRYSLLDRKLEESGWTTEAKPQDFGARELIEHFIESGQAEALYKKEQQIAVA